MTRAKQPDQLQKTGPKSGMRAVLARANRKLLKKLAAACRGRVAG